MREGAVLCGKTVAVRVRGLARKRQKAEAKERGRGHAGQWGEQPPSLDRGGCALVITSSSKKLIENERGVKDQTNLEEIRTRSQQKGIGHRV